MLPADELLIRTGSNKMFKKSTFIIFASLLLSMLIQSAPAKAESKPVSFLLPCVSNEAFCIESIIALRPDGTAINGLTTGRTRNEALSGDDSFLKYIRGQVAEWSFPGLTFQNGTNKALLFAYYWPADNLHCWNDGNCSLNEEELGVYLRASNFDSSRPPIILTGEDAAIACPKTPTYCNIGSPPWMIDQDVSFEIAIRTSSDFQPLYSQGRLKNLLVQSEIINNQTQSRKLNISFSPVKLQNVYFAAANPSLIQRSLYVTDEAALWIYGLRNSKSNSLGYCGRTGGLQVTSNAYFMWNPSWNSATESIDVKLESTHFDLDGATSKGLLQVRISKAMAKCLWTVDLQGNVKAAVAIDYGNGGTPEVVTIVGNLKGDYFELTAANFHFSAPTLKLKISGDTSTKAEEVVQQKIEGPVALKKTTITCTKGKVTKKVTATNPKCPAGYKKK